MKHGTTKHKLLSTGFDYLSLILLVIVLGILLILPRTVLAAELITRVGGEPVVLQQGETVEKVLVFNTDVRIAGRVTDMVVVINGNVELEPSASVDLVVDLGGHVANASSQIKSGIFELNWTERLSQELLFGALMLLGVGFVRVVVSVVGIMLLSLGGVFLAKHLETARDALAPAPARLLGIGLASALVLTVLIVLLSLSVVGLPLALLLVFLSLVVAGVGLLPLLDYWGKQFLNPVLLGSSGLKHWFMLAILYVGFANVPLLGLLFSTGTMLAGLGLMVAWALRRRQTKVHAS